MSRDFGRYRLLRPLGEGGMARVWAARRRTLGGPLRCAVKIIGAQHASEPGYREMFLREGRIALALAGHDNVVSVFDVGEHEGRLFLAMERIDGVTLTELAQRRATPWPVPVAVYVAASVLRALCHIHGFRTEAHPQGIVHRDVTPHNVMVSARGEVKLMDFGIAQAADAEPSVADALGKLGYVPREQVEGEPDQRSDLYAVGAVLFELLDGRRFRWHCADEDALFQEIYRERVPVLTRTDVPAEVRAVLRDLLQPDRGRRIASAAEALRRLEAWSGSHGSPRGLEAVYREVIGDIGPRSSERSDLHELHDLDGRDADADAVPRRRRAASTQVATVAMASAPPPEPGDEVTAAIPESQRKTPSAPVWAAAAPPDAGAEDDRDTRALAAAERLPGLDDLLTERVVTRRHRGSPPERDVPMARNSAEIAVTQPIPSKRAPWAADTDPIARGLVSAERGAPWGPSPRPGSVSPRRRESASMHRAASALRPTGAAGEIVIDDDSGEIVVEPHTAEDVSYEIELGADGRPQRVSCDGGAESEPESEPEPEAESEAGQPLWLVASR